MRQYAPLGDVSSRWRGIPDPGIDRWWSPFLGKTPRVRREDVDGASTARFGFHRHRAMGNLIWKLPVPVITSRRVGGSSILLLVDETLRFVQPSRLSSFRRRRRDADHCCSRLHRKLDYGVLRDRPYSRARRRRRRR